MSERRVNLLERFRAETPVPAPTAAPRAETPEAPPIEAPTSLDAPELAAEVAALRVEQCGHGRPVAECAECLLQLFLPRQLSLTGLVVALYAAWPLRCDECDEPAPATHETPESGSDLALCTAHARRHADAAPIQGAHHLDTVARLMGRAAPTG